MKSQDGTRDIANLTKAIVNLRDARDWKQFHNAKDLALSLSLEAGEVMEHFQWKSPQECLDHIQTHKEDISDELADVLYWVLLMSNDMGIDIGDALLRKLEKIDKKYPIEKAKGSHKKYTEL